MTKQVMRLQDYQRQPRVSFKPMNETDQILERAVLRLNANILGLVLGITAGLIIFAATNFLILKGGEVVGPHLSLLRAFFPFYSVTFLGSIIGFGWGFLSGYVGGFIIAFIYNLVVKLKSG